MKFTKMQGLGNDYVYVNGFEERIENPSEMAAKVSNRNFGVGSDGLILINPSEKADFELSLIHIFYKLGTRDDQNLQQGRNQQNLKDAGRG